MVQARPRTPIQELLRRMPYTLHVGNIPGGRAEFITIQAAIDYAVTQTPTAANRWTVLVYPGTYAEQVAMAQYVDVVGVDRDSVIVVAVANETAFTMANDSTVANLTIDATASAAGSSFAIEINDTTCTIRDLIINLTRTANACVGIRETTGDTARTIYIRNVRLQTGDVATGIHIDQDNKTVYIENCYVDCSTALSVTGASTIYSDHNHWDGSTDSILLTSAGGVINLNMDIIATTIDQDAGNIVAYGCQINEVDVTNGGMVIYGGNLQTITRAGTSVVWWRDNHTLDVLPSGTITDAVIGYAVTAAGAGDTIIIHPGTYEEAVTLAAGINLVGIDKELCVINIDHATLITMAEGCFVANLTLDVTADATGNGIGIEFNDAACTIHDLIINLTRTANVAYAISEATAATARTIYVRNVRVSATDTNTTGLGISQANKTIYIENCWVDCDYAVILTAASTIYSDHNLWDGDTNSITLSAGTIQMTEDTVLGGAVNQTGGTCTYRDSHDTYHVFLGMYIQDALTAGAGGEVVIHDGDHYPPNPGAPAAALTVAADTLVRGQGKASIIHGAAAAANITNLMLLNGNNITVKDIKLILDAGCGTAGARPNVIYASAVTLIWLENLWIVGDTSVADDGSDARQNGVYFDNVDDSKIVHCRSEDNDRHGIHLGNGSDNNTVTGNTCQGNTYYGIRLTSSLNNTITGNICQGNGYHGIQLSASSNNTVTENTCQGNISGLSFVSASNNNTLTGNTCQGNIAYGIQISASLNNTITGNICADNDSAGNTYSGIYITASNENTIVGNQCDANGLHGIEVWRSSYCSVTGNVCNNQNTGDGINIAGDATTNSDYNTVTGNVCTGNGSDGIEIAGAGDANKNIVLGNQLLGNGVNPLLDNGLNTTVAHNVTV